MHASKARRLVGTTKAWSKRRGVWGLGKRAELGRAGSGSAGMVIGGKTKVRKVGFGNRRQAGGSLGLETVIKRR